MTKQFNLLVDRYQAATFASPVRSKQDVVVLWMNVIKAFLANQPPPPQQAEGWLSIAVKSMSRLFFGLSTGRKMFSVSFPFSVRDVEGELLFFSREGVLVDSRVSSQILGLLDAGVLIASDFWGFADPVLEAIEADGALWTLLRELLIAEDAYVRYDWDEERADGHMHPVHHLDLGYSNSGTFKLGLQGAIDYARLAAILDVDVDCDYLLPAAALSAARSRI